MNNWIAFGSLVVAIVALRYLVTYVKATESIARQSIEQVEATFRPAIVAVPGSSTDHNPGLVNIGNGPALGVHWSIPSTTKSGAVSYLRPQQPGQLAYTLEIGGMKPLYEAAAASPGALIECRYQSISGRAYSSVNQYNVDRDMFTTSFSPIGKS